MRSALAILGLVVFGCQAQASPHLVGVTGLSSDCLAEGDLLELRGTGFPEGRPARVTLRGDLYRPSQAPERGFELVLPARSSSPHTVAAAVTREVAQALSGPDGGHTTFRGSVEAAFFPLSPGMPPVTGGLPAAVLDIVPIDAGPPDALLAEAERFAEHAGVLFSGGDSLVVDGVMPKSPAERAGVARGDRISELAGLRVLERADLVPPPRARQVELVVHRNGSVDPVRLVLETDGFRKMAPRDLAAAGGVLAAVLALFAVVRSPLGRALSFLELRLVELLRLRRERRRLREIQRGARRRMPGLLHAVLPASPGAYLALAAATGLLMFVGMGGTIVAREVDLGVLTIATIVATSVTALVFRAPGERGALARLCRVGLAIVQAFPLAGALGCAAVVSRGIGVDDLARAQGALPWQWHAFQSPVLLAATVCFVASQVPEALRGKSDASPESNERPSLARVVPDLVGWAHLVLTSGIGALAFFGGARSSALGPTPDAPLGAAFVGAGLLVLKALFLVLLVLSARAVIGRLDVSETRGLTFRVLLPMAACSLGLTLLVERADVRPVSAAVAATLGLSSFVGVVLLGASFARRVAAGVFSRETEPGVNPWI